jgi:diaminohydroxyphosphoribosylaminopyrimidine deaminase/5-amino-6-(5-phosphoribosylamino)uracil reductase
MTPEILMQRTLDLANKGLGTTWPNPMVGAVIVKNGKIIGEGFHQRSGEDHAELAAIKNGKESLEGATLYVNLEPCCHTNKQTPPCAQRLIQEKIKKVVICNLDPNPAVNGKGVELLRQNGIEVEHGLLQEKGEALNEVFFHAQRTKSPFVHVKMASTLDGRIALPSGESQWITGEKARAHVHLLRSQHQAIAVGAETARTDNPKLNVRLENFQGKQPWRIIFTESGNIPQHLNLLNDELRHQTLIYSKADISLDFPAGQVQKVHSIKEALQDLFERKIISLMVEGGSRLSASFLEGNHVQRISNYLNPSFLGAGPSSVSDFGLKKLGQRPRLKDLHSEWLGEDLYLTGRVH